MPPASTRAASATALTCSHSAPGKNSDRLEPIYIYIYIKRERERGACRTPPANTRAASATGRTCSRSAPGNYYVWPKILINSKIDTRRMRESTLQPTPVIIIPTEDTPSVQWFQIPRHIPMPPRNRTDELSLCTREKLRSTRAPKSRSSRVRETPTAFAEWQHSGSVTEPPCHHSAYHTQSYKGYSKSTKRTI